jgi:flagellin-like protein
VGEPAADRFGHEDDAGDDERSAHLPTICVPPFGVIVVVVVVVMLAHLYQG